MSVKTIYFINALRRGTGNPPPYGDFGKIQGLHRADMESAPTGFVEPVNPHHKTPPKRKFLLGGVFTSEYLKQYIRSTDAQDKKHNRTT